MYRCARVEDDLELCAVHHNEITSNFEAVPVRVTCNVLHRYKVHTLHLLVRVLVLNAVLPLSTRTYEGIESEKERKFFFLHKRGAPRLQRD